MKEDEKEESNVDFVCLFPFRRVAGARDTQHDIFSVTQWAKLRSNATNDEDTRPAANNDELS